MNIETKSINTVRVLAADMVQKANSGHPGAPMGIAPAAYALWAHGMKHNPKNPAWADRDRFVLSMGHASALEYSLLHVTGYDLPMEELKNFRQLGSKTPGHPEYGRTPGVETTTGPLGQGIANAVGFAIAETMLAAKFNREGFPVVDHRTYAVCGDGCLQEGIAHEAISLAGNLKLNKLTLIYDDNDITIEGSTDITFTESVPKTFEACEWNVIQLKDGNDHAAVIAAIEESKKSDKPTVIICPTKIGFGCPAKEGKASAHGEPLGEENLAIAKETLGMSADKFFVADDVYAHFAACMEKNQKAEEAWNALFARYQEAYPELAAEWNVWHSNELPDEVLMNDDLWHFEKGNATRATSGEVLNKLAAILPNLVGGSADLAPSNKSDIKGGGDYSAKNRGGRNMHFGIREHAMGAICNGMALHGGLRVYCATFFVFSDYMKHAMRMASLMNLPVMYILTHDSIGVGEDGATHQPVEHLSMLRSMPNFHVFRPADAHETTAAYLSALTCGTPTAFVLSRQNLPLYAESDGRAMKGAYVLGKECRETPDVLLMGSGSEVEQLMQAKEVLCREHKISARVISVPCMDLFLEQSSEYQEEVMPSSVRARVAMEAGATMPWYRFVGLDGKVIGMDHFGDSAPAALLFKEFGFTCENVVSTVLELVKK
ncbi:MAG: transketolase [Clostridiales bacterium]|nr:transketolase [Clostridiales bacterium]